MLVQDAMHTPVVTIASYESLPEAVEKMQALGYKRLPVLHDGQLVGLLTDGDVKRALPSLHDGLTPWEFTYHAAKQRVRDVMCQPVLTTTPAATLNSAVHVMLDRRVGGLPVLGVDGLIVGMLTITDVLRAASHEPRTKWGAVRQHMTTTAISVTSDAPASKAAALLKVAGLKVLPVLNGEHLVGVLHASDVAAAVERGKAAHGDTVLGERFYLAGTSARDLMRAPGGYVLASAPMHDAITGMLEADVHGLPVISDGGRLLGVVTVSDVLRALVGERHTTPV